MKKLLILPIIPLMFAGLPLNQNNPVILEKTSKSQLNYSESLGLFRDLTNDEIKDYYKNSSYSEDLKGDDLLSYLQPIISNNHKMISNSAAWNSDWRYFALLDRDWDADPLTQEEINNTTTSKVGWKTTNVKCLPLYTPQLTFISGSKTKVDREHIWPKSRGFKFADEEAQANKVKEQPYAATDMQNLRMGDSKNNENGHNNLPFGNVKDKSTATQIASSTTNEITGYVGDNYDGIKVYEPRDVDKGDIARSLFYMATRYHNYVEASTYQPSLKLVSSFSSNSDATATINVIDTKDNSATYGILSDLLEWNKSDPVDEHEIHRNNLCYNIVQFNRNPFVDYPAWADIAFGESEDKIDLDSDDGIKVSDGLSIKNSKNYQVGDTISRSDFTVSLVKEGVSTAIDTNDDNLTISISYSDKTANLEDNFKFEDSGTYKFDFTYEAESETYSKSYSIQVSKTEDMPIVVEDNLIKYIVLGAAIIILVILIIVLLRIGTLKIKKGKVVVNKSSSKSKKKTTSSKKSSSSKSKKK